MSTAPLYSRNQEVTLMDVLNLNSMIDHCIRKTILSSEGLTTHITKCISYVFLIFLLM